MRLYTIIRTFNATEWSLFENTGRIKQDVYVSEDGRSMRPVLSFWAPDWEQARKVFDWAYRRLDWRYEKGTKTWPQVRILIGDKESDHAQLALAFPKEERPKPRAL